MTLSRTVPALPVRDVATAAAFYTGRLGFDVGHLEATFAILRRDGAEVHLWAACDRSWRIPFLRLRGPVRTGAESFLAGTASCRIQTDRVDELYAELHRADVLHPTDPGHPTDTDWGTREVAALDRDGNLLTFYQPR